MKVLGTRRVGFPYHTVIHWTGTTGREGNCKDISMPQMLSPESNIGLKLVSWKHEVVSHSCKIEVS